MTRWMTTKQAAEHLGCSAKTVQRHIAAGYIRWHETPGGLRRIDREELDALFVEKRPERIRGIVTEAEWRKYVRS